MNNTIKIGCVNIDTSHPLAFAQYYQNGCRARYAAVYNDGFRSDSEVEAFVKKFGMDKHCRSIEELADICDIGFIQGCNWDLHLKHAAPFIERAKPVFIDKPIVGSLSDCREITRLIDKGAVIIGGSSLRYVPQMLEFSSLSREEKGEILHIYGTVGVDEFNYAIHIVEIISQLADCRPVSVKMNFSYTREGCRCENYTIRFESGLLASYTAVHGVWQSWALTILTTKRTFNFEIETTHIYDNMLDYVCDHVQYGKSKLVNADKLIESIKILLAAKVSRENNGLEILISELPQDAAYDGAAFAKAYAQTAPSIYL